MWKRDTSPQPVVDTSPQPVGDKPSPTPARTPPPGPTRIENRPAENVVMNLGKSVVIKGELSASEDLTLYGQMEGRVTLTDHTLTIGPEADIRAEIVASIVVVMGSVTGNVNAGKRVEIRSTGSVKGDIGSLDLVIHEGGRLQGKVDMRRTKAPK
jgi:cytoskeletal protein CcmA (bactofilin family)